MVNVGTRIRLIRILLEMQQEQFAELIDMPQSTLSMVETGRLTPTDSVVSKVQEKLGVSLYDPRIETFTTIKETIAQPDKFALAA